MPVTKRSNGHYQVTVCFGGRTYRKTSRHWNYAAAKEYERKWLASVKDAAAGRQQERLISEGIEKYLTEILPRLSSAEKTKSHVRALVPYTRNRKMTEIAQVWAEIQAVEMSKAPATVNHKGRILRQISRLAWKSWNWIDRPAAITLLTERPRETFLTVAQVDALARACTIPAAADYLLLAAYTGIRRGHLLRLTRHEVKDGFIRLDRSSKTRTLQMVPLHPKVSDIASRLPLAITEHELRQQWAQARKACGLTHVRWHDLRHTCASWLVQAGVPLHTVSELLGHSSMTMTRRYAHLAPQHLADAIAKLA